MKNTLLQKTGPRIPLVHWLIILLALSAYAFLFPKLYLVMKERAIPLGQFVTIGAGALLGVRGGLFYGLMTSVTIGFLVTHYAGYTLHEAKTVGLPATFLMLLIGGGVGFCRDLIVKLKWEIKERKRVEGELRESKEKAEAASRAKSQFLSSMSHEFRTPLNHIIGFTELVVDEHCGKLNEVQQEYLRDVHTSSTHLLSLINDVLDLARVESGKMELDVSDVNPRVLLENALGIVRDQAKARKIKLSLDVDGIPDVIRVDERKFKQVVYNLLSNAVKFTPEGGCVTLAASSLSSASERLPASLDNGPWRHRDCIEISVKDTGIGIRQEDMEGLFDPFTQGKMPPGHASPGGTGLGLSLARKMVELHGGKMWGKSDGEGKGSTFRFIIPSQPWGDIT